MNTTERVTLSVPTDVLMKIREAQIGNLSQFVTTILRNHFEQERRRQIRERLIEGYKANAEEALETANAFRYVEDEAVHLYVPPYNEDADAVSSEIEKEPEPALMLQD